MNQLDDQVLDITGFSYQELIGRKTEWTPKQNPRNVTVSGMVNALDDEVRVDSTAGAVTMTLETAVGCDGRQHTFKKIDASANAMIIDGAGTETIDGAANLSTAVRYTTYVIKSNGTNWDLISSAVTSAPGTVTTVSVVTANGVSGSVATATTTPAITLTLAAITPTTVTPSGLVDISAAGAGQVKFPATQNASADANTLDDYEEGTWTPVLSFGGASVGLTYTTQTGKYTKIGNRVFIECYIVVNSNGSSSGAAKIGGLPFTSATVTNAFNPLSTLYAGMAAGTITAPTSNVPSASTTINLGVFAAGGNTDITEANVVDGSYIVLSGHYSV